MGMANFLVWNAVSPRLSATTREDAIRELIHALAAAGQFPNTDLEDIVRAVLRREQLGSTGIGHGIAIPHSRHTSVTQLIGTLGVAPNGIPFDSIDGEPVYVLVLLISPQDRPADHLRALESVVQSMHDESFVAALRGAETREQIRALVEGAAGR